MTTEINLHHKGGTAAEWRAILSGNAKIAKSTSIVATPDKFAAHKVKVASNKQEIDAANQWSQGAPGKHPA
jgi:hypothetical protein